MNLTGWVPRANYRDTRSRSLSLGIRSEPSRGQRSPGNVTGTLQLAEQLIDHK